MKIISIDPGYDRMGLAILEKKPKEKEKIIFSKTIETKSQTQYYNKLFFCCSEVEKIIKKYQPEYMAIEKIIFSKNTKTAIKIGEIRGSLIYLAQKNKIKIREFNPKEIKISITGYGNSSKAEILNGLKKIFDLKKMLDDEADAIAIGLTFFATLKYYNAKTN